MTTSLVDFILKQVVNLPEKFYLVDSARAAQNPILMENLANMPIFTRDGFVSQVKQYNETLTSLSKLPESDLEDTPSSRTRSKRRKRAAPVIKSSPAPMAPPVIKSSPASQDMASVANELSGAPMSLASNISESVTFKKRDLLYILDQLIKSRNENYLLRARQEAYEHVLTWSFNFLTFVQAFSTLVFHNGLPISAVIFNTDMFNVPFALFDYIERKMERLESDMDSMFRNVVWTQGGTVLSRAQSPPEGFTFRRPETNAFLENVQRIRRDYSAFAEAYNQPNDFVSRGLIDIVPDAAARAALIEELRALCAKYNMSDFSPQYLLQQSHLASLLMHFATTIYSYVPQLQVDLVSEANFEFSLSKYLARLRAFWQKQTNLAIGPFHVQYARANMNRLREVDLKRMYEELVSDRADYANLSVECQQTLSQLTFNSLNRHVSLGPEIRLANTWRNLFNELVSVPDAGADLALFRKFLEYASADRDNMFSTRVLVKFDRIFANDYLANLVYNFREQIIILKLIVVQLIVRMSLPPSTDVSYMGMHDPIMALKERLNF